MNGPDISTDKGVAQGAEEWASFNAEIIGNADRENKIVGQGMDVRHECQAEAERSEYYVDRHRQKVINNTVGIIAWVTIRVGFGIVFVFDELEGGDDQRRAVGQAREAE